MPIKVYYFSQHAPCLWGWPLKVAVINKSSQFINQLHQEHWAKTFTKIENLSEKQHEANVLYLDSSEQDVDALFLSHKINCDVVIVKVNKNYFSHSRDETQEQNILKAIADKTNANAVFILSITSDLSFWFNNFIIELSHNKNIKEALEITCENGCCIYDDKLERESTLSFLIEQLNKNLVSLAKHNPKKININSRLTGDKKFTLTELSDFIADYSPNFRYDHESGTAEGLMQLMDSIDKEFNISILEKKFGAPSGSPSRGGSPKNEPNIAFDKWFNSTEQQMSGAELEEAEKEIPVETQRFIQTQINDSLKQSVNYLKQNTSYTIKVRIGNSNNDWKQSNQQFPTDQIFTNPNQEQETIQIHFTSNYSKATQIDDLILRRTGNTNEIEFMIQTDDSNMAFNGQLFAYHKNRVIQKISIISHVIVAEHEKSKFSKTQMQVDFSFCNDLNDLTNKTQFGSSIYIDSSNENDIVASGIASNKPLDLNFSPALGKLVQSIKNRIQDAVINIEDHPEDLFNKENEKLLLRLASYGNNLFVNHLKKNNEFDGPMQIVSNKSEFVPLDFVYSFAAPDAKSILCPNASTALEAGVCCNCDGIQHAPAKYICPFGFWGFSHVIERHTSERYKNENTGDYSVIAEPNRKRETLNILKNTLFAATAKVNIKSSNLKDELAKSMLKNAQHASEANDWNEWSVLIQKENPDSLIMLVHIEKDEITDQEQIEIGDKQFLIQTLFDENKLIKDKNQSPPFVVLIGCEATNIENSGFDISSQLINLGAAIVVSNFTKIRGRQAVPIVMKLLDFLKENAGNEITLGQIILKLRQYLLSKGIMVSLALIAHGDADWKIKT